MEGLICGFALGALVVLVARLRQRRADRCHYCNWVEGFKELSRKAENKNAEK